MRPEILNPLFSQTESITGVGPRTGLQLDKLLGVRVIDLLLHFPTSIIERQIAPTIISAKPGNISTITVTVKKHHKPHHPRQPYRVKCEDDTGKIDIVFFRAKPQWISNILPVGKKCVVSGLVETFGKDLQIAHPDYVVPESKRESILPIEPVYPLTEGLSLKKLQRFIETALSLLPDLDEWLDDTYLNINGWDTWKASILKAHQPTCTNDLDLSAKWRSRLAYDELLANQLALNLIRLEEKSISGRSINTSIHYRQTVLTNLKFSLTKDQNHTLNEIDKDMESSTRMARLLQGDVGSGKTIVAILAILNAVESGAQAALMVPTEILARQHYETLSEILSITDIKYELMIGRQGEIKRKKLISGLKNGEITIIIGTHALFQEDVIFKNLGLVIIDEQHRFGVHQRLALTKKGINADLLVMTATPIPRTLLLTEYGDMDVSRIINSPSGRGKVKTKVLPVGRIADVEIAIKRAVDKGAKVYWVCPLIESSNASDLVAALQRYESLKYMFGQKVGLIHGKMKSDKKDSTMYDFKNGKIQVLVATTVIEVGVDVPDATVMVVEYADRFGLSQLHQLRGRIGRNSKDGTCLLLYKSPLGQYSRSRLEIMRNTNDGFKIAEQDLKLRGAGEVLGTKQSGFPRFRIADLDAHADLLSKADKEARLIIKKGYLEGNTNKGKALKLLLKLFERNVTHEKFEFG